MFDSRIHAYLRANAGGRAQRVGPFLALIDDLDAGIYRNYAVPDDGAAPTAEDVELLVAAFVARSRKPRLEYLPGAAPEVEAALLAAGFAVEGLLPVMTCPGEPVAPEVDVRVRPASSEADFRGIAEALHEAYDASPPQEHDVARMGATVRRGGLVVGAFDGDLCVGGGLVTPPHRGVGEVAGIGVRPAYRRRGIAGAVTALLTASCPAAGITDPFLMTKDPSAERTYRRVGYRRASLILHISR